MLDCIKYIFLKNPSASGISPLFEKASPSKGETGGWMANYGSSILTRRGVPRRDYAKEKRFIYFK
jgi:hypothetical protein